MRGIKKGTERFSNIYQSLVVNSDETSLIVGALNSAAVYRKRKGRGHLLHWQHK